MTISEKSARDANSEVVSELNGEAFADRLRALIGSGSANAFARECSIGESSVRQYLAGGVPGLDKVIQIARSKKVRVEWLATGEGPRDIAAMSALHHIGTQQERVGDGSMQVGEVMMPGQDVVMLPRLAVEASAGRGIISNSEEVEGLVGLSAAYLRQIGVDPEHAHMLQVSGRSMVPTINDKDVVVVDASKTTVVSEGIYTLVYGDAVLVKRIRMLRDGSVTIVSDNKSEGYGDEYVSRAELNTLRIVGQVKGQVRAL